VNTVTGIFLIIAVLITLTMLAGYAVLRRTRLKTGPVWLPATLLSGALATALLLIPSASVAGLGTAQVQVLVRVLALVVFVGLVSRDLAQRSWRAFVGGGGLWLAVIGIASLLTEPFYGTSGWMTRAITVATLPELILMVGTTMLTVALLVLAFRVFYVTPLPEVSNRALFWVFNSTLMMTGFTLTVSGADVLIAIGLGITTVSYVATVYAQISYRVFDIRNILGLALRLIAMITTTSVALFGALYLIERLSFDSTIGRTLFAGTLGIVIAALYVPVRELTNIVIEWLIVGRTVDAVEATKRYSYEVSRATEINELVAIATRALNHVLSVKKSGMMLVSDATDNGVELSAIPIGGLAGRQNEKTMISQGSPLYQTVVREQRAVSQFDVEFNPDYAAIPEAERAFFRSLEMSAYAPIIMDNALIGMLACGSKSNDAPLYQHDLELLAALANQTGVALRNTRLVEDLRRLNASMQELNATLGNANDRMGKLDSVKTDFVTIASHELRTPLAQVRGYTDIIDALNDQGMLDQDQTRGLVTNLRKATERMEELIAAMLDVSQLDVNAMDLRFAQASPESVLRMSIEPLTDAIKQRKLTLSARGLRGLPSIEADMQRLVQAFRNIITNAIKFTPDGGRIDITASHHEAGEAGSDYVLIAVSDTGVGVGAEDTELIFNKFYRAADPGLHSTGTYKFMGAGPGLGLTIAKGVIEGHGGRIWVESPGYDVQDTPGSTFYVQLPLVPPENARRVLPFQRQEETRSKPLGGKRTGDARRSTVETDRLSESKTRA